MTAREPAKIQPKDFVFTKVNQRRAEEIIAKYPKGRQQSAVLPVLDIAQRQNEGWLSIAAMNAVAELLHMPYIKVYEVASFYSMFNLKPVGKYLVQVCRTTPCWLNGSDKITDRCKKKLGLGLGETTKDGKFTLVEVECLGACVNAPMVQINDDYYEDLSVERLEHILDSLARDKKVKVGTQIDRINSAPLGGPTTLTDAKTSTKEKKK